MPRGDGEALRRGDHARRHRLLRRKQERTLALLPPLLCRLIGKSSDKPDAPIDSVARFVSSSFSVLKSFKNWKSGDTVASSACHSNGFSFALSLSQDPRGDERGREEEGGEKVQEAREQIGAVN